MKNTAIRFLKNRNHLLLGILILLHLLPLWLFPYFPSQDGPTHVYNAYVIKSYHQRSVLRRYYEFNGRIVPNWIGHFLMALLMGLVPVLTAEKILLSLYVILLPLSVCYALRALRKEAAFLTVLIFPFIYNYLLHKGFYNFCCSLPVYFWTVGYWLRYRDQLRFRAPFGLLGLSLLLYFCHLTALAAACVAVAVLAMWFMLADVYRQRRAGAYDAAALWRSFCSRALVPFCAFLPALLLAALFLRHQGNSGFDTTVLLSRIKRLIVLESLISHDPVRELLLARLLLILFLGICLYLAIAKIVRKQFLGWDGLLLLVGAYLLLYLTVSDWFQTPPRSFLFVSHRLMLFPFFVLLLWFGAQTYHRIAKLGIQVTALMISLAFLGLHTTQYHKLNQYLHEYVSGSHLLKADKNLLALCFADKGFDAQGQPLSWRIRLFCNVSCYQAAQRHLVSLNNYAAKDVRQFFPICFRPDVNPDKYIRLRSRINNRPPSVAALQYPTQTNVRIDYILLWGLRREHFVYPDTRRIVQHLRTKYQLIFTSPQRGLMRLYRLQDR